MNTVVDRIKKLLRLSQSPNIHEAQLALDRAFEIAAKYQVDIQTLDLGEDLNAIVSEGCRVGYRLSLTKRLALNVLCRFFNVNVVISRPDVNLIGTRSDIAIANHVFEFLYGSADRAVAEVRKEYSRRFTENRRRNFIAGWFYAITAGLDKGKEQALLDESRLALILTKGEERRDQRQKEIFPRTSSIPIPRPKRRDHDWMAHGFIEGKKVKINPAVPAPAAVAQIGA